MSLISGLTTRVSTSPYSSAAALQKLATPTDAPETKQTSATQSVASKQAAKEAEVAQAQQHTPFAASTLKAETVVTATAKQDATREPDELTDERAGAPEQASVSAARHEAMQSEADAANSEKARVAQVDEQNRQIAATNPAQGAYASASLAAVSTTPNATVQSIKMML